MQGSGCHLPTLSQVRFFIALVLLRTLGPGSPLRLLSPEGVCIFYNCGRRIKSEQEKNITQGFSSYVKYTYGASDAWTIVAYKNTQNMPEAAKHYIQKLPSEHFATSECVA